MRKSTYPEIDYHFPTRFKVMDNIRQNRGNYQAMALGLALTAILAVPIERSPAQRKPETSAEEIDRMIEQLGDEDYLVRQYVAKRLKPGRLFRMITDTDREVRKTVASRLPPESLGLMTRDSAAEVRLVDRP